MSKEKYQAFKLAQEEKKKKQHEKDLQRFLDERKREQRHNRIESMKSGAKTARNMLSKVLPDKRPSKPPPRSIIV
jgi:oligoendopeptidase F